MEEYSRGNGARGRQDAGQAGYRPMMAASSGSRSSDRNAGTGNRGMSSGIRDAGTGNRGMSSGNLDAWAGNRGMSSGIRNAGTGNRGMSSGNLDAWAGNRGMSSGIRDAGTGNRGMSSGIRDAGTGNRGKSSGSRDAGTGNRVMSSGSLDGGTGNRGMSSGNRNAGNRGTASGSRNAGSRGTASGGRNQDARQTGAVRPSGDRQTRARVMARRKRRRRQRRMIISGLILLLILIASGIFFGVSSYKKGKIRQTLLQEGIGSMESGNYEEAIVTFDKLLAGFKGKVGSFEAEVLTYRGEAEYKQKDYSASLHTFELLVKEDGEKERYQRMICYSQMELGNYEAALSYGFADAEVYSRMALRDIQNKQYDAALENVQKGIAACEADDPSRQELAYSQAVIYEHKGDFVKALELFEAYLESYGPDEKAEREVTFLKTRQGRGTQQSGDEVQQSDDGAQPESQPSGQEAQQGEDAA